MKYCPNCAKEQNKDNKYCERCGEKFKDDSSSMSKDDELHIICCIFASFALIRALLFYNAFGVSYIISLILLFRYKNKYQGTKKLGLILNIIVFVLIIIKIIIGVKFD